ncbi:hypothetical protein G6O67_007950 [Ophiocordyceps sinensis]|uniref:Uncharacterized protein n=1 Tax=Ophiocordyceps sinensis TaxID=72228 RepID=A0A8H4PJF5_9HYPO|nr:hypothetical protein G6O67_007950 [Ophiocordyceps sinensis]
MLPARRRPSTRPPAPRCRSRRLRPVPRAQDEDARRRSVLTQLLNPDPEPDRPVPLQVDTETYADADADSAYGSDGSGYTGSATSLWAPSRRPSSTACTRPRCRLPRRRRGCAPWTREWVGELSAASVMYGKPINVARFHRQWMMDAGFDQVQEVVRRM